MKLTKILPLIALTIALVGCNRPAGELVGARSVGVFKEANPYGMLFIKKGSFMMGANTQSAVFEQPGRSGGSGRRTPGLRWQTGGRHGTNPSGHRQQAAEKYRTLRK